MSKVTKIDLLAIRNEFKNIAKGRNDLSLNWCEKRKAWGALRYDFNEGSSWFAFILMGKGNRFIDFK